MKAQLIRAFVCVLGLLVFMVPAAHVGAAAATQTPTSTTLFATTATEAPGTVADPALDEAPDGTLVNPAEGEGEAEGIAVSVIVGVAVLLILTMVFIFTRLRANRMKR